MEAARDILRHWKRKSNPHVKVALGVILLSVLQMRLFIEAIRATVGVYSSTEGVGSTLLEAVVSLYTWEEHDSCLGDE